MTETEKLYDLIIPPGVPRTIIMALEEKYDVTVVPRKLPVTLAAMDQDVREILVFRGELETIQQVETDMKARLQEFIDEE